MAKNSLLELTCGEEMNEKDGNEFSRLANERADQWKSLVIDVEPWEAVLTRLRTYRPPKLEGLHVASWYCRKSREDEITLLGGDPAAGLKDFKLNRAVIQLASLQLTGLEALHLQELPQVSAVEIIVIIAESPTLKVLYLSEVGTGAMPSQAAAGQSSLASHSPIRLPFLINLHLRALPPPFLNLLLSILIVPQLCCLDINCRLEEQPPAEFFAAGLVHLHPTLNSITSNCHKYEVSLSFWDSYDIHVGGLTLFIAFGRTCSITDHFQGAFNWLSSHLDVGLSDLPLHLNLQYCKTELPLLKWFTQRANVTELTLAGEYPFDTPIRRPFPLLGYPTSPP
ncbi:hypothetical protein FRC01_012938 [Tulasnella sp. 417]|nr:hypothetical protein FRC01_012938 [Tulasnella sp. 417]